MMIWPQWTVEGIKITGGSVAGVGTCFYLNEYNICLDVAQGLPYALHAEHFFITHGHMDHAAGIPYIISQRALNKLKPANFYMPQSLVKPLTEIMQRWSEIEGHEYGYNFIGLDVGERVSIRADVFIESFETIHRVPCMGFSLIKLQKRLRKDLVGASQQEIIKLKSQGIEVDDFYEESLLSFTGDTKIDFIHKSPQALSSRALITEVTYYDDKKPVEEARKWGHIHLDEVLTHWDQFKNSTLAFSHLSRRYSQRQVQSILKEKMTKEQLSRVLIVPSLFDFKGSSVKMGHTN